MNQRDLARMAFPTNLLTPTQALRMVGRMRATAKREGRELNDLERGYADAADAHARYYNWTTAEIEAEIENGKKGAI